MKKLFIIILLLFTANAFGQNSNDIYVSSTRGWSGTYGSNGADSLLARIDSASITITASRRTLIQDVYTKLRDSLRAEFLQDKFDYLYFLDAGDSTAKLNWVKDAYTITNNGCIFDTTGVRTNGEGTHLNTNYKPLTNGITYSLNLGSYGIYNKTDTNISAAVMMGAYNSSSAYGNWIINNASDQIGVSLNGSGFTPSSPGKGAGSYHLISVIRENATTINIYKNETNIKTATSSAVAIYDNYIYILGANNENTLLYQDKARKLGLAFLGGYFSATDIRKIYNIYIYWLQNKNP